MPITGMSASGDKADIPVFLVADLGRTQQWLVVRSLSSLTRGTRLYGFFETTSARSAVGIDLPSRGSSPLSQLCHSRN